MERARKLIYTKPSKEEPESKVFNMDNPEEFAAAIKLMEDWEKERLLGNKNFIGNFTSDLYSLDEMIVEEMKTKSDADRILRLVTRRLEILKDTHEDDEFSDEWIKAINKAEFLISDIKRAYDYLPDKLYSNPESLSFDIDNKTLIEIFERCKSKKYEIIPKDTDFHYFAYAIKGVPIPAEKQPYKPIRLTNTKTALYEELMELQKTYDKKEQSTLTNKRKKNAGFLFVDDKGKPIGALSNPK